MAKITLIACAAVAVLAGCATSNQVQYAVTQDYGPEPTADQVKAAVVGWASRNLKDPESARYIFGCPFRAYVKNAVLAGPGIEFSGWMVMADINAKNSYGGYTGFKGHMLGLSRDGRVTWHDDGLMEGHPRLNITDWRACMKPQ